MLEAHPCPASPCLPSRWPVCVPPPPCESRLGKASFASVGRSQQMPNGVTSPIEPIVLASDVQLAGALPLVGAPQPLDPVAHAGIAVSASETPFGFAREATTLPVVVEEFGRAGLDFPLVFYGPERRPVAVCAVSPRCNLFVDARGGYAAGVYIPAYLRRHPFFLASEP